MPEDPTFIELVAKRIKSQATQFDPGDETAPTIILWPDATREWESILPRLRQRLPILTWGSYDKEERCGPAVWIRCMIAKVLRDKFAPNTVPILYLPGISQAMLTTPENRPREFELLAESVYTGECWSGADGICWSVIQFFQDNTEGLGIQMRDDAYERWLMTLLLDAIGKEFASQIHPSFQTLDSKTVCKLAIDPAPEPVFIQVKQNDVFFLRVGNATNGLGVKAAVNYYKTRWASR